VRFVESKITERCRIAGRFRNPIAVRGNLRSGGTKPRMQLRVDVAVGVAVTSADPDQLQ
jgi:hypothetical protein